MYLHFRNIIESNHMKNNDKEESKALDEDYAVKLNELSNRANVCALLLELISFRC